uniref:Uncharacterized protein n=1 Tax=Branchiostoma floridae TaxID=7739 RepID=C3YPT2_BRAFL|eukprot:XP_002601854.1 hypothetical protein BRAFLDRAFT_75931 [Branchiostoma floridae]
MLLDEKFLKKDKEGRVQEKKEGKEEDQKVNEDEEEQQDLETTNDDKALVVDKHGVCVPPKKPHTIHQKKTINYDRHVVITVGALISGLMTKMFGMNLLPYILGAVLGAIVSVWVTILYQGFLNDDEEEDTTCNFPEDQVIAAA